MSRMITKERWNSNVSRLSLTPSLEVALTKLVTSLLRVPSMAETLSSSKLTKVPTKSSTRARLIQISTRCTVSGPSAKIALVNSKSNKLKIRKAPLSTELLLTVLLKGSVRVSGSQLVRKLVKSSGTRSTSLSWTVRTAQSGSGTMASQTHGSASVTTVLTLWSLVRSMWSALQRMAVFSSAGAARWNPTNGTRSKWTTICSESKISFKDISRYEFSILDLMGFQVVRGRTIQQLWLFWWKSQSLRIFMVVACSWGFIKSEDIRGAYFGFSHSIRLSDRCCQVR